MDINDFIPSLLNPRTYKKNNEDLTLTQGSLMNRSLLSLKKHSTKQTNTLHKISHLNKENLINNENVIDTRTFKNIEDEETLKIWDKESLGFSIIEDLFNENYNSSLDHYGSKSVALDKQKFDIINDNNIANNKNASLISISSCSELIDSKTDASGDTVLYDLNEKAVFRVTFGFNNCNEINVDVKNGNLKNVCITRHFDDTNIECDVSEISYTDSVECFKEKMIQTSPKNDTVAVNLELKKHKLLEPKRTDLAEDKLTVLNLKTNAIEKLTHVIVQPPNYKLVKRKKLNPNNLVNNTSENSTASFAKNGKALNVKLKQTLIDSHFKSNVLNGTKEKNNFRYSTKDVTDGDCQTKEIERNDTQEMSKISGVAGLKCEIVGRTSKANRNEVNKSPRLSLQNSSLARQDIKTSCSDAARSSSPKLKKDSIGSYSPKRNFDSIQFSIPVKSKSNKTSVVMRNIPYYKIVAGTHFAVDAFSYGEIPNVKHYFLTHFHSDHYAGLKKSFNKILFCSKITADLCMSRLGVSSKCIHVINVDETLRIEGVEVTAVDANHCPGAIMLVFLLPNGKTMLHTGDFRATPAMESYPIFWNRDIHTIYLDTTYCNPRYDFPTQDQSLEMALYLLRQKKMQLEKVGKKFSSVLIVCGTYTIGKEKFFMGMARRVGCSVWACPEKDRVLQTVEGRSFCRAAPSACQLHVVPMKDLTHEKLRKYLESLQGTFSEVVAFKPSGWENGKNSSVEKDFVTIYGIPYSEHSSFSELVRFVKYLRPKQVVPTVDISGGIKSVQKFFPCPLVQKEDIQCQSKLTDFFKMENRQQVSAVT